jgi:hypothetical protein
MDRASALAETEHRAAVPARIVWVRSPAFTLGAYLRASFNSAQYGELEFDDNAGIYHEILASNPGCEHLYLDVGRHLHQAST